MLLNMPDAICCPACETLRPAAIGTTVGGTANREASSDAAGFISSTGFIFGSSVGDTSSFPKMELDLEALQEPFTKSISDKEKSVNNILTSSTSMEDHTIQSLDRDQIKAIVKCTDGDEKFVGQHRNAKEELASSVFDNLDTKKSGELNSVYFEALIELLGEGFHGDELQEQLSKVDAEKTGFITKDKFVEWYRRL